MTKRNKYLIFNFVLFCAITYFYFTTKDKVGSHIVYTGARIKRTVISTPLKEYLARALPILFLSIPKKKYDQKSAFLGTLLSIFLAITYMNLIIGHLN